MTQSIALLTDFGLNDTYVGSLKASALKVNPALPILDLCHNIQPQNIDHAAFVLRMVYQDYPKGTVFTCVVDPGVGTERHAIAVQAGPYYFVGPDNGLFTFALQEEGISQIVHLNNESLWNQPVSQTFHGRDIFGPCAAHLATNQDLSALGSPFEGNLQELDWSLIDSAQEQLAGRVGHVDRFGNLITSIHQSDVSEYEKSSQQKPQSIHSCDWNIRWGHTYEDAPEETLVGIWGSSGFLEIAMRQGSAQQELDCGIGEPVYLSFA